MKRIGFATIVVTILLSACSSGDALTAPDSQTGSTAPAELGRSDGATSGGGTAGGATSGGAAAEQCGSFDDVLGDAAWRETVLAVGSEPRLSAGALAPEQSTVRLEPDSETAAFRIERTSGDDSDEVVGRLTRRIEVEAPDTARSMTVIETSIDAIRVAASTESGADVRSIDAEVVDGLRGAIVRTTIAADGASDTELCLVTWLDDEDKVLRERVLEPISLALPGLPASEVGVGGAWKFTLDDEPTEWGSQGGSVNWKLDRFDGSAYVADWSMAFEAAVEATTDPVAAARTSALVGSGRVAGRLDQRFPVSSVYEVTVTDTFSADAPAPAGSAVDAPGVEVRRVTLLSA